MTHSTTRRCRRSSNSLIAMLVAVLAAAGAGRAQRTFSGDALALTLSGVTGAVEVSADSNQLRWRHGSGASGDADAISLPFDRCGCLTRDASLPNRVFVSGYDATTTVGYIVSVLLLPGADVPMIVENTTTLPPNADPVSVYFNAAESRLYYLDYDAKAVLAGDGIAPSAFRVCVDSSSCEALAKGAEGFAVLAASPTHAGVRLVWRESPGWFGSTDFQISAGTNGWTATAVTFDSGPIPLAWAIWALDAVGVSGSLRVRGPAAPFRIVHVATGSTVGAFVQTDDMEWQEHLLPSLLAWGELHRIEGAGAAPSWPFRPAFRVGTTTQADGLGFDPIRFEPSQFVDSNARFAIGTFVSASGAVPAQPVHVALHAKLVVPGQSPVTTIGSAVVLDAPELSFGVKSWPLAAATKCSAFHYRVNLAGTQGLQLVFQFVALLPSGAVIVSDIVGGPVQQGAAAAQTLVAPAPFATAATLGSPVPVGSIAMANPGCNTAQATSFLLTCYSQLEQQAKQ